MSPTSLPASLATSAAISDERGNSLRAETGSRTELDTTLEDADFATVKTLEIRLNEFDLAPPDVASLAEIIQRLRALEVLSLRCTSKLVATQIAFADQIHETCRSRGIAFAVHFVLDAEANAFAALAATSATATSTRLLNVLEASRQLRTAGATVRWLIPLDRSLIYRLEALFSLARDEEVDPVLMPDPWVGPTRAARSDTLTDDDRLFVCDFIAYRLLEEEKDQHTATRRAGYRTLMDALSGTVATAAAPFRRTSLLCADRDAKGLRWTLCFEDRPAIDPVFDSFSKRESLFERTPAGRLLRQTAQVGGVLLEGALALAQWSRAQIATLVQRRSTSAPQSKFARVLLIGAYGGEHIGDAAILGGVLFRINRRHGTTEGTLMSQRPLHTRHLIPMLATPFKVEVEEYEHARIRACLQHVDAVVFAGGPLIDLPKQLVKHLYTVSLARRYGKPFIIEGIGPGPFPRWPSEWTARRLVLMADSISLRTRGVDSPLMRALEPKPGRDPAFDYLETRGAELSLVPEQDRQWIERLLDDTQGRLLVGMNLRPIRHLFTVGAPAGKRVEFTRDIEARFEEQLAEGMRQFHQSCAVPPCFVFFPMNAIQFGMSDLRSAYRVQRLLRADVDFRVWEADASLDGVVALLRKLDIVITMRFHATIFALAQQRRVIGIDYRVGKRDKVGVLLGDLGQGENCRRIDELTSAWLLERLKVLADAPLGRSNAHFEGRI